MKKYLFFLFLIIANMNLGYSQIIAGSAASGLIISNPAVSFSVTSFTNDSRFFDLDCDGFADMSVELHKGPTAIDFPNYSFLHILNTGFQICADTANWQPRHVNYFNLTDTIICPAATNWYNDTLMQLGNCGCMDCPGPCSATDLYLGYKNTSTSQIGWIKISFNLLDGGGSAVPITLSVPEVLSPCITTSVSSTPTNTNSGVGTCGVFSYSYTIHQPSCSNSCDGSISITNLTGGTPVYAYFWQPPLSLGPNLIGVCEGTYSVTITDAVGNTCTTSFVISDPAPITFSLTSTNVTCNGGMDGSVCCANVMGGSAPYSFMWLPIMDNTSCMNNLPAGNYSLCATDANGCQVCNGITVSEPQPITFSLTATNVSCNGLPTGNACFNVMGGVPPYYYSWSDGVVNSCDYNLFAGYYTFCAIDANGCQLCGGALVNEPSQIVVTESITQASCISCCDGSSQLQVSGGIPPYSTVYTNTPSCPGVYSYTVTDNNGCIYVDSVLISYPTSLAENGFENGLDVFPNPSKGIFEIKSFNSNNFNVKIKVLDVYGKSVSEKITELQNQSLQLNLNVADGIYFLHISEVSSSKEFVKKIIVHK